MGKSAGFLKRLKKIKDLIGKGASWVNNNIVKPLNPIIDTALDFVPGGSVIKTVKNVAGNYLDNTYGTKQDDRVAGFVKHSGNYLLDTQRTPYEKGEYRQGSDTRAYGGASANAYGGVPQPKAYSNPFGQRIN